MKDKDMEILLALLPTLAPVVIEQVASFIRGHPDTTEEQRKQIDAAFARGQSLNEVWANLAPKTNQP